MAGIYIKGMEIPKGDSMIVAIRPDGMIEDVMGCYVGKAVPVPPHGRLIDGGVAEGIYFTEEDENGKDFCDGILYAADWISKQPTIIPAEPPKEEQ